MRGLLIVNPRATTTSPRVTDVLVQALSNELDLEVTVTTHKGHGIAIGERARAEGLDIVVTLGGDGVIHEVVNGLLTNGVHGHGEKSELHAIYLLRWRLDGGAFTTGFAVGARKPVLKSYFRNLGLKLKKCLQNFCA